MPSPTGSIATANDEGFTLLTSAAELIPVFDTLLRQRLGENDVFVDPSELDSLSTEARHSSATLESIEVQTFGDHNELLYLVLRGHDTEGNCILSAVPLTEIDGHLYLQTSLQSDLRVQQEDPGPGGGGGCNYSHSCAGHNCRSCDLTISNGGCSGDCHCSNPGSVFGGASYCNHSVSSP